MRSLLAVAVMLVVGCDDGGGRRADDPDVPSDGAAEARFVDAGAVDAQPPELDAAGPPLDAEVLPDATPPDLSEEVFDPAHLIEVDLEVAPADWEVLRIQGRTGLDLRGAECLDAPFPSPYDWFEARAMVDGLSYAQVGIRKKGFFGSLSSSKPSLRIEFDRVVAGQTHRGMEHMAFNNSRQDPSLLRTCTAYSVFRRAGLAAPRCNLARIRVNGEELGLYVHVELLKKPFLQRNFGNDSGYLYEGTLSDFQTIWSGTFEQKTDEEVPHRQPIALLTAAAKVSDDQLIPALEAVLDLDQFLTFWATEVLTAHWDGYAGNTNNFWFYEDPTTGKVVFIPWGTDGTFQRPRLLFEGLDAPWSVFAVGVLARRLYQHPEGRARYLARLERLMDSAWDVAALHAEMDAFAALVAGALPPEQRARHTEFVEELKGFVADQPQRVRAEIAAGPVDWRLPLRESICLLEAGSVTGTFETVWGSWPTDDVLGAGAGSLAAELHGRRILPGRTGSAAGLGDSGEPVLVVVSAQPDGDITFVYMVFQPQDVAPGELNVSQRVDCSYNQFDPRTRQVSRLAACLDGTVTFEAGGTTLRSDIRGQFDLRLYAEP